MGSKAPVSQEGNGKVGSHWVGGKQQPEHNDRQQLPPGLSSGALKGVVWTAAKRSTCTLPNRRLLLRSAHGCLAGRGSPA